MNIVTSILGGLAAPVVKYFERRMEIKAEDRQQERALKRAEVERKIDLIKTGLTADMNWEMEFARQASSSWKDEYTLIVVSIPAVMAFVPGLDVFVARGFTALSQTPAWYQLMLVTLFFATVGIRYWRRSQTDT
jgi:hypothetical protein